MSTGCVLDNHITSFRTGRLWKSGKVKIFPLFHNLYYCYGRTFSISAIAFGGLIRPHFGNIACYDGHLGEGQAFLEESWSLCEQVNELWLESSIQLALGHAAYLQGDYGRADILYKQSLEKQKEVIPGLPDRYEKLANVALHLYQPVRAARLLGAAEKLRQTMGAPIPPVEQAEYHESLRLLCSQLDDIDKNKAWDSGAAMVLNESIAYALEDGEYAR